jgi:hypothetical protein
LKGCFLQMITGGDPDLGGAVLGLESLLAEVAEDFGDEGDEDEHENGDDEEDDDEGAAAGGVAAAGGGERNVGDVTGVHEC